MKSATFKGMDSARLIQHLYGEKPLPAEALPLLESTVAQYPYYATVRLALIETLLRHKPAEGEEKLACTAVALPERKALFGVMHPEKAALLAHLSSQPSTAGEEVITFINEKEFRPAEEPIPAKEAEKEIEPDRLLPNALLSNTTDTEEIIERFLATSPKIIPKEVIDYQADNESGNQDNHPLVTETLAQIFASQGHSGKARQIYQVLMLKFPEKSNYFADRIRELP